MTKPSPGALVVVPKRRPGRPNFPYDPELGAEICARIASGETLIEICREEGMPSETTVRMWALDERPDVPWAAFPVMYARARLMSIEHEVEEIKVIADNPLEGEERTLKHGPDGVELTVRKGDMLAHRRLQIDARKWRAAKIAAHAYGDRLARAEAAAAGSGGEDPNVIKVEGGLPDETGEG